MSMMIILTVFTRTCLLAIMGLIYVYKIKNYPTWQIKYLTNLDKFSSEHFFTHFGKAILKCSLLEILILWLF